jgi:hypothetical protein
MTLGDRSQVPFGLSLSELTVRELWQLYSSTLIELRTRKRIRGTGTVVGDYAEYLAAAGFGLELTPPITAGHDAVDGSFITDARPFVVAALADGAKLRVMDLQPVDGVVEVPVELRPIVPSEDVPQA